MKDERTRRTRLDHSRKPIAIIHDGVFVYANPAFLKRLGYDDFAGLEAITALDMVSQHYRDRFRDHLKQAEAFPQSHPDLPSTKISLRKNDGSHLIAIVQSHQTTFESEKCIQICFRTKEDASLKNTFIDLPWKLYLSVLFLLAFNLFPPLLLQKLNINNAPKIYFPQNAPAVVVDDALRDTFPSDQVLILLFEGVALYSDGYLNAFDQLAENLKNDPRVEDVISVTTQDHIAGTEDGFSVEPLIDVNKLEETRPKQRMRYALADRFANKTLIAEDGSALALIVVPAADEDSIQRLQFEEMVLAAVQQAKLTGYLTAVSGQLAVDVAEFRAMLQDNMIFIPATVVTGLLLIWWLFRHWIAVIVTGVATGVVTSSTVAFYVLMDKPFTLVSSIISPLLSALTIAFLVHFFNALHHASQRGYAGKSRVERALAEIRQPSRFTALTTAAGLASLATSPIPPIQDFGLISAGGVILIYFVVIGVVPNIFARWDYATWPKNEGGLRWMDSGVKHLLHLSIRHPAWVAIFFLITFLAGAPQILKVDVESNLQEFFQKDHPLRKSTDRIEEKLVGTTSLDVVFESPGRGGLKKPENLNFIKKFQLWVEQLPEVDKSFSHVDMIEEMNWAFHKENPSYRRIPENESLISQYLFVYDGEDLFDYVDRDFSKAHVNLSVNTHKANDIELLTKKIRDYLASEEGSEMAWDIAGAGRLFVDQVDLIVEGQIFSLGSALCLIFILMLILWRSFKAAVLCMIPNLSPIFMIFIIMGGFGIWLDVATVMIASVAVGIAVDDTVHIYHGFSERIKKGTPPVRALVITYRQAGRAVMTTTAILCAQFMILASSVFMPTMHFGMLTSIGLVAALIFDLVLLPSLLIMLHGNYGGKTKSLLAH